MQRSALALARGAAIAAVFAIGAGCGGAAPVVATPKKPVVTAKTAPVAPPPASLAPGHLARDQVDSVLMLGPSWIFRRVLLKEELRDNKFIGWRVLKLPNDWSGIDLKPGDVVTRVNGMAIERPEDFFTAWSSLTVSSDLRVTYERDNASRELVYHIDGQPSAAPPPVLSEDAPPPPRAAPSGPPRKTVVIVGDDPPMGESAD